jgi:single-stranded DNA-binding protein
VQNLSRGKSGPAAGPSGDRQEDHGLVAGGQALVVAGRLQQRSRTADDGSARSVVEVVAEELGAEPPVGDGDDHQGDTQLRAVADSTDAMVRDLGEACSRSAPSSRATIVSCAR